MNNAETPTRVVLILTRRQAEALASLITRSEMHDRWVDSVRTQLPRSLAELSYQRLSAAGSAFAAAQAVVDEARVDIMAEPEATDAAQAPVIGCSAEAQWTQSPTFVSESSKKWRAASPQTRRLRIFAGPSKG